VEDETLSCGTGVTASAIAFVKSMPGKHTINIQTLGGDLTVECNNIDGQHINDIWLSGQANFVFEGDIEI
jgi:diaminopimelate epimerase